MILPNNSERDVDHNTPTILQGLPSVPAMLGQAAFKRGNYRPGDALPANSVQVRNLFIDPQHLNRYREVCGFGRSELVPATYLSMLTFPMFLKIVNGADFPLKAMGQVHLANTVSVLAPVDINAPLTLTAAVAGYELTSAGLQWQVEASATVEGQLIWTSCSTSLYRCRTDVPRVRREIPGECSHRQNWEIPADIGRRYARASGDYNPIHLADITARLLGFKKAIAHGMWSKARCLAELQPMLPESGYRVDVAFNKPVFLPSDVRFSWQQREQDRGYQFAIFSNDGELPHLNGSIDLE